MSEPYRVFGSELSPYSVKVRSYLRYKRIPHVWIPRSPAVEEEFRSYARLPLIPLVVTPLEEGLQDSTPILETLETRFPERSIHPEDPTLAFLSALLEEFADEWANKWMFHYRWWREVDQRSAAARIAAQMLPERDEAERRQAAAGIRERMIGRLGFVGSSERTRELIEESYAEGLELLEAHLDATRPYLFGGRPAFADFGLAGQLYACATDPTAGAILRERAPRSAAWVERMQDPPQEGAFETRETLLPTLEPLLARPVSRLFLPWSDANARALERGEEELRVELAGRPWAQKPQKYHAKSLRALRARYAAVSPREQLDAVLERSGCRRWLEGEA